MAVRDTGPGVPEDGHARVFDRFWRGQTSRRDRHSGLGLAIVRQVVESHGGHGRLFSRLGGGSVFVLWLPSGEGPAEGGGSRPEPSRRSRPGGSPNRS